MGFRVTWRQVTVILYVWKLWDRDHERVYSQSEDEIRMGRSVAA
jgi:hypothetical protein